MSDGLYPDLSHFHSRSHQTSSSSSDLNPLIRLPSNGRCSHCQRELLASPGAGIGWKSDDEDVNQQFLNREREGEPSSEGREQIFQGEITGGEGPNEDHRRCARCIDLPEDCKDPEACGGPFSSSYCGHCRKPSQEDQKYCGHCRQAPQEDQEYCGHCRQAPCEDREHCGHCRQAPQEDQEYCGHCKRSPQENEACKDPEACGGPFSCGHCRKPSQEDQEYCGHCRQAPRNTCYEGTGDGNFGSHEFMFGGESSRGRNYVMEGSRLENVLENVDEKGPHWWHHSRHHEIPHHHVGAYSWVPCESGDIPSRAVKVGRDVDGARLYLGRAWHEGDLLPAKVAPSHGGAFVAWGGHEHSKFEYEVLVTDSHRVAWVESSKGNVPCHALVVGHTHHGEALYAGRVLHGGSMTPGKIQHSHGVLYIPWGGRELHFDEYEVLVVMDED